MTTDGGGRCGQVGACRSNRARARSRGTRLDLADGRRRPPRVQLRERSLRGRAAPRDRHRRRPRLTGARRRGRSDLLRRNRPREWEDGDRPDRERLLSYARPSRLDRRITGRRRRRRATGRHHRPQRECRGRRAVPPSRRASDLRPEWVRRPAVAAAASHSPRGGRAGTARDPGAGNQPSANGAARDAARPACATCCRDAAGRDADRAPSCAITGRLSRRALVRSAGHRACGRSRGGSARRRRRAGAGARRRRRRVGQLTSRRALGRAGSPRRAAHRLHGRRRARATIAPSNRARAGFGRGGAGSGRHGDAREDARVGGRSEARRRRERASSRACGHRARVAYRRTGRGPTIGWGRLASKATRR
jgi:hypothetical protein